jgi:flagellar L-ring protein precursor FlgH
MVKNIFCFFYVFFLSACLKQIHPMDRTSRTYKKVNYAAFDADRTPGSLWSEGAVSFFEDARARRLGDLVTIRVEEKTDASRDANTSSSRKSETSLGVSSFLAAMNGLIKKYPGLDPSALVSAASEMGFNGGGSTKRSGSLDARLPVHIIEIFPNGDFYVRGEKTLLLNEEESYLSISGVLRPYDIDKNNMASSSVLADVKLEYTGRGVLSENARPGWFARLLGIVWPF